MMKMFNIEINFFRLLSCFLSDCSNKVANALRYNHLNTVELWWDIKNLFS